MGREGGEVKTNLQIQNPKARSSRTGFRVADKPLGNLHKLRLTWGSNNVLQDSAVMRLHHRAFKQKIRNKKEKGHNTTNLSDI